jgi:hypothetical protein
MAELPQSQGQMPGISADSTSIQLRRKFSRQETDV